VNAGSSWDNPTDVTVRVGADASLPVGNDWSLDAEFKAEKGTSSQVEFDAGIYVKKRGK
jgi:hypothetical protein